MASSPAQSSSTKGDDAPSAIERVRLDHSHFAEAMERYLDENKPDPLVKRQIADWTFTWTDDDTKASGVAAPFEATHALSGTLVWKGSHLEVVLQSSCQWQGDKEGALFFVCSATVRERSPDDTSKESAKVHVKMVKRLLKDDYISKLLQVNDAKKAEVCQASIQFSQSELEERVHSSDAVAEGIRRAVFSHADSSLDVFDVLLQLPILPTTTHSSLSTTTALADRALLRLLEDATYDACEKEEEEELLQDLDIKAPLKRQKQSEE